MEPQNTTGAAEQQQQQQQTQQQEMSTSAASYTNTASNFGKLNPSAFAFNPAQASGGHQRSNSSGKGNANKPLDERSVLQHQLEYYFSQTNLKKDRYLLSQMSDDNFVRCSMIASFPAVQALTKDNNLVVEVMRQCPSLEVDKAGNFVRAAWSAQEVIVEMSNVNPPLVMDEVVSIIIDGPVSLNIRPNGRNGWYIEYRDAKEAKQALAHIQSRRPRPNAFSLTTRAKPLRFYHAQSYPQGFGGFGEMPPYGGFDGAFDPMVNPMGFYPPMGQFYGHMHGGAAYYNPMYMNQVMPGMYPGGGNRFPHGGDHRQGRGGYNGGAGPAHGNNPAGMGSRQSRPPQAPVEGGAEPAAPAASSASVSAVPGGAMVNKDASKKPPQKRGDPQTKRKTEKGPRKDGQKSKDSEAPAPEANLQPTDFPALPSAKPSQAESVVPQHTFTAVAMAEVVKKSSPNPRPLSFDKEENALVVKSTEHAAAEAATKEVAKPAASSPVEPAAVPKATSDSSAAETQPAQPATAAAGAAAAPTTTRRTFADLAATAPPVAPVQAPKPAAATSAATSAAAAAAAAPSSSGAQASATDGSPAQRSRSGGKASGKDAAAAPRNGADKKKRNGQQGNGASASSGASSSASGSGNGKGPRRVSSGGRRGDAEGAAAAPQAETVVHESAANAPQTNTAPEIINGKISFASMLKRPQQASSEALGAAPAAPSSN